MKSPLLKYSFCCILFVSLCFHCYAGDEGVQKSKSFTKSYPLSSNDRIMVKINFGDLKIVAWNKKEVKIEANMWAQANSEERAQEILDQMSIETDKTDADIFFKSGGSFNVNEGLNTKLGQSHPRKIKSNINRYENENFKVIATLFVPEENFLIAEDVFGNIEIGNRKGKTRLASIFGSLVAGNLANVDSVTVSSGKGIVESMNSGFLLIASSHAQVNKLSGPVKALIANSSVKLGIGNELAKLDMTGTFNQLNIEVKDDLSALASIEGQFENETDISNKTRALLVNENYVAPAGFSTYKKFKWKSGTGTIPINIRSHFGFITFGTNIPFDVNDPGTSGISRKKTGSN